MKAACQSTIGDLVRTEGLLRPDAPVIFAPGVAPLRWAELSELLRVTEADLREAGIRAGDVVGLGLGNGPELAAAFIAVTSSAVCAPLNPRLSDHAKYLAEVGAKAAIVGKGMEAVEAGAKAARVPVIRLLSQPERGAGWFRLNVTEPVSTAGGRTMPDGTALVLPTSGTTSRPKLVPLSHRNLCASARSIRNTLALTESDRCLNVMPLVHIHGLIAAVLASVDAGGSVVCTRGFSGRDFASWLDEFQPTWYTATPTIHHAVVASMAGGRGSLSGQLRLVRSCSAALPPRLMGELETLFATPVIEAYGMTEASHQMSSNPLPPGARKRGSVGLPAGSEIALMDDHGRLLTGGGTGEIVIRGENVFSGYLNQEAENRDMFRDGWFRTGDQGWFDEEGYLHLKGRTKELINRGGEKIAPREIEEVLLEHPAVARAVSFAIPHLTFGEDVGAAVVPRAGVSLNASELRSFAAERLVDYKVPRVLRVVADIPEGPTGKLQRIGMAERLGIGPVFELPETQGSDRPATELEELIALLWQEALHVDRVRRSDDFFALGGDSLSAVEMLDRVSVEEDIELPQISLYEYPTLQEFSEAVGKARRERSRRADRSRGLVPIRVGGSLPPLFVATTHLGRFWPFVRLTRYLGPDQPIFGFPPPLLGTGRSTYRIESLATSFVELIRAKQPRGPYFLMGNCLGGFIVYETARQLEAAGEQIAFLGLMNAYRSPSGNAAGRRDHHSFDWNEIRSRVGVHSRTMSGLPAGERLRFAMGRWRGLLRRLRRTGGWRIYQLLARGGAPMPKSLLLPNFASAHALSLYHPRPCRSGAVLIRAMDERSEDRQMGWQGLLGGQVELIRVAHELWTEQGVAVYGPEVARRLKEARSRTEDSESPGGGDEIEEARAMRGAHGI